ncbi:hypothetical protein NONO_c62200 [Nocardia nova SH22a]|uniref:Uncharacterized protein n=1 Tax=Nocardia nova SH22a TaxID=1415166 RepID=W5TUZ4_9NOCA|nr:hypothetical protein NONO_c62200 [Nocardia nova SH22a]
MKQMVTLIQDSLSFHPLGYPGIQIVGYLLEFDNLPEDSGGVFSGL